MQLAIWCTCAFWGSVLKEIEESFLRESTKLKGNYFKGLGFGVQTKRTSDRG